MLRSFRNHWGYVLGVFFGVVFITKSALAIEFGGVRALQRGPIGDSPQFADIEKYEPEGALSLGRAYGKRTIADDADKKLSTATFKTRGAAGFGMSLNRNLALSGYLDLNFHDYDDETRETPKYKLSSLYTTYELAAFVVYTSSPLVVGGGVGAFLFGGETRDLGDSKTSFTEDISSAAMPVLRIFGGLDLKEFVLTAGFRPFSQGEAQVEAKQGNEKHVFDISRKYPAEFNVDGRLRFGKDADLGAGLAYVFTGQASEQVDEYSMRYETVNGKSVRVTGGDTRNTNHFRMAAGGRYNANKMISLLGSLQYIQSSYKEEKYASLEHENLGGVGINLGGDVSYERIRGFLHTNYMIPNSVKYEVKDSEESQFYSDRTMRAPLQEGETAKLELSSFSFTMGGGYSF